MSSPAHSKTAVSAALAVNVFITIIKFVAAFVSGSGAMLSEAVHSAADAGNQLLLFLGIKRAARESDEDFHYGYGGERFVFGLLSAAGIFFVGCGVTVYHGVHDLMHPPHTTIGPTTWVVLALSFLLESGSTIVAVRSLRSHRSGMPLVRFLREKADPATLAILLEDGAALLGLSLAAVGIAATRLTGTPVWDSVASILVGALLGVIAVVLVFENRALLLGKAVPSEVERKFVEVLKTRPSLRLVRDVKSRQLTPESYFFKAEIVLDEKWLAAQLDAALPRQGASLEGAARRPTLGALAASVSTLVAGEIDAIEVAVRKVIPEARHIDLEVDYAGKPARA